MASVYFGVSSRNEDIVVDVIMIPVKMKAFMTNRSVRIVSNLKL